MRGVPVKSITQQDVQALHRIRERQIKARTALINQIRGLLMEYGIVIPQRASQVRHKLPIVLEDAENGLTATAREWPPDRHSARRGRRRCDGVQEWPPVRRLAGPGPSAAFHGREDDAARDDEAGELLSSYAAHPWCPRGPPGGRSQHGCPESLAPRGQSPAWDELRQRGPGQ